MEQMYVYNFNSLGRPIIQFPQDMVAVQELVWDVKPDLIIETGIAHGGSLIQSAMMLAMLDLCEAIDCNQATMPTTSKRKVLGIDIDIRQHNREAIENHPMSSRIEMIEGSAIASDIVARVHEFAKDYRNVMVMVDSMHTHDHVIGELEAYSDLVSVGNYFVVFDSFIEDMPENFFADRPWDKGNNPKTALHEWLKKNRHFEIDESIQNKLLITVAPDGYLKRIS
jgi:cephalosporin hydroxylase